MRSRPISITIVGWVFVAVGVLGLAKQAKSLVDGAGFDSHMAWAVASELVALGGGVFLFSGNDWARWVLVVWMAFHIVLSAMHDLTQLLVHCAIFGPILYALFRRPAAAFFTGGRAAGTPG